ncbi:MAG: nucleotidyltransferase domain-containing protein [Coprobacillus sp.]|nr:nucleotidyltransferase domain-containing protein [Coprobacillus sp.]
MEMSLKELRESKELTQAQCALYLNVPLRTYQYYEEKKNHEGSARYELFYEKVEKYDYIDEEHGLLTIDKIIKGVNQVFSMDEYKGRIDCCYLFGSYAKGYADEQSDVDLYVKTDITAVPFYGLVENLRVTLGKVVELLNQEQIEANPELAKEILLDGVKIYG